MIGLTAVFGPFAALVWVARFGAFDRLGYVGIDYRTFVAFGERWLTTGSLYLPSQFTPFDPQPMPPVPETLPAMYPPIAAPFFAALTVLPGVLWWAPVPIVIGLVAWWRPKPWAWPLLALLLAWPNVSATVIVGGSSMWIGALFGLGLVWGWPAALVILKPSFAPLALIGIRHRSWWIAMGILGGASLVMLSETLRYLEVVRNAQGIGLFYSLGDLPIMLIPLVACLGRALEPSTTLLRRRHGAMAMHALPDDPRTSAGLLDL